MLTAEPTALTTRRRHASNLGEQAASSYPLVLVQSGHAWEGHPNLQVPTSHFRDTDEQCFIGAMLANAWTRLTYFILEDITINVSRARDPATAG
jgi:hypothetical protein